MMEWRRTLHIDSQTATAIHGIILQQRHNHARADPHVRGKAKIFAWLVGVFAAISLALTLAGVFAVMAAGVAERRREIGVRLALGAQPRQVRRMIVREVVRVAQDFPAAVCSG